MADFKSAFQQGIDASDHADAALKEIATALDDFFSQVHAASNNVLHLSTVSSLKQIEKPSTTILEHPASYSASMAKRLGMFAKTTIEAPEQVPYRFIRAYRTDNPREGENLCEIEFAPSGYPVTLVYSDQREDCYDKASLDAGLERLLKHAASGAKLKKLIRASAPKGEASE